MSARQQRREETEKGIKEKLLAGSCGCAGHAADYTEQSCITAGFRFGGCENVRSERGAVSDCVWRCQVSKDEDKMYSSLFPPLVHV